LGLAIFSFCSCAASINAQTARSRIVAEFNTEDLATLRGSANPRAKAATDMGQMDNSSRLTGITMHFAPTAEQKAELDALVTAQQTPGSPLYRKWLTPAEYAVRFGLSDADLEKVKTWLEQQGFSIDSISNSRNSIAFSGTVAQVKSAFKADLRNYRANGEQHFGIANDLSIPSALDGIVQSIGNLNDFRPSPKLRFSSSLQTASPYFTSNQSGSHFLTPKDIATIYDINAAYSSGYTGTGQSIAVVGQSKIVVSDIEAFQSAAGLTIKDPTQVLVPNSGTAAISSGDEAESDLDIEYSGGIAKGATIYFVYVGSNTNYSVWDSINYAVDTNLAPIISVSYGVCETAMSTADFATLEAIMEQGASQGQSIIVASGDDGSTSCYGTSGLTTTQQQALAVSYPASSSYVTALGGTEFSAANVASTNTTYWASASGSDVISSALSYIPEVVWNDDSSSSGLSAGGGGVSIFAARPSWQTGVTGIPSGNYRLLPDISLSSSPNNAGYLYCSSDSTSTGISGSCSNGFRDSNNTYLTVAGGTSFAAPVFAGMLAIINQKTNSASGQGLINRTLYTLATDSATYASAFHDITSGTNACTAGSSFCSSSGQSGYAATTGYDEATGLGSVDFYNLLSAWPSGSASTSLFATTTTLTTASSNPSVGASDVVTITVAPQSSTVTSTPSGTLSVSVDGSVVVSSLALSNGSATYTFSSSTAGSHVITAAYSGDTYFAASSGTVTVTVASSSSTASGGSATATVTVTPSGGYTGTVAFTLYTSSSYLQNYACYTLSDATVSSTNAVSQTLTVYAGTATCSAAGASHRTTQAFRRSTTQSSRNSGIPTALQAGITMAGFLCMLGLPCVSKKRGVICGIAALSFLGFALIGCGGSSSSSASTSKSFAVAVSPSTMTVSSGTSGIPTGTYSLTLEGQDSASSSLSSSASVTLVVN
jgi:Predicted protease